MASTTRGLAFAVTEEPGSRVVDWGLRTMPASEAAMRKVIAVILKRARPLFVAIEPKGGPKKRHRGHLFGDAVEEACKAHGIMLLSVQSREIEALADVDRANKWDVAKAMAERFPDLAPRLPKRRKAWKGEDDRIGLFMALAAAAVAWDRFGARR